MKNIIKFFTLLTVLILIASCESRGNDKLIIQYESELSQNVNNYEFVDFKWYKTYTVKDSLRSEIEDIRERFNEVGNKASRLLDKNKYESKDYVRESNIKKAEINLNYMKTLDSIANSKDAELKNLVENQNDTIYKQAIHTFKGNDEVYKVLVRFDGNNNFLDKGATVKAVDFDNTLEIAKRINGKK